MRDRTVDSGKLYFGPDQNAGLRPPRSRKPQDLPPIQDHRSRFYVDYRRMAKEYDKEFLKRWHDGDLDTTLIFVSFGWCAWACAC